MYKKSICHRIAGIIGCLLLIGMFVMGGFSTAKASSMITDDGTRFAPENDLSIKMIDSPLSYTKSSGVTVEKLDQNNPGEDMYVFRNIKSDSVIEMTWDKVGTYRGKNIGAMIRFSNFVIPSGHTNPILACNNRHYFIRGYNFWSIQSMDTEYIFFYEENGDVIDIPETDRTGKGSYMTFSSLNVGEFVSPMDETKDVYTAVDTVVKKENVTIGGKNRTIFVGSSNEGWNDGMGKSGFEKASVAIPLSGSVNGFTVGQTGAAGYYYVWSYPASYFIYLTEPETPAKTVNAKEIYEAETEGEEITYEITQKIHVMGEDISIKYKSLVFQDQLPQEVTYIDGEMLDGNGKKVSSGTFIYDKDSHNVTYTFSSDYLENEMPYDGSYYRLQIHCKIREGVSESFENHAKVSFNDIPIVSNTVTVVPALSRSITITKKIQASDINFANGTPTFFFELQGTDKTGETYQKYQMLCFEPEYVATHIDAYGWVEKSCTFSDLQKGTYVVVEEACSRYRLSGITDVTAGTVEGSMDAGNARVRFQLTGNIKSAGAVFQNKKYEWGSFSGSDSCVNQIGTP